MFKKKEEKKSDFIIDDNDDNDESGFIEQLRLNLSRLIIYAGSADVPLQKEVAEKICNTEKSSYMSLLVSYFYETKFVKKISRDDFYPSPKVDSGLIVLNLKKDFPEVDVNKLSPFLHKVFRTPRKKLNKVFAKEKLESLNISPDLRPENLKIEDIIKLYNLEGLGKN